MHPINLTCESIESPINIDSKHPRLSWKFLVDKNEFAKYQTAYHILVASSEQLLEQNIGDLWDSGKTASDQSVFVEYQGKDLQSRMQCFWKVKVWDENYVESDWSAISHWIMGIFHEDWQGEWIGARAEVKFEDRFPVTKDLEDCPDWLKAAARREHPHGPGPENDYAMAVYLRKEFVLKNTSSDIERALVRIAGLGYYELSINGEKIGDHVLDPGAGDYTKSIRYVTYDVTKNIRLNENCIGIILGNGWYWVGTPDLFGFEKAEWAAPPKCRMELEILYKNGHHEIITTDNSWKCTEQGPIRFNCIRSGEIYDARLEIGNWDRYGGVQEINAKWKPVLIVLPPRGLLRSQISPPIKIMDKFAPSKRVIHQGSIVYWFPKNNAGWVEIKIKGNRGQNIKIELNEVLDSNGSGKVDMHTHSGHTYGRYQTLEYICKGEGVEVYHPRFCYAGFQYAQITGATPDQIIEITAHQVCTALTPSGEFYCSDILINAINNASKLTYLNGFHSYPQDCPQREKAGWTEDALLSAHGAVYNFNGMLAYEKWIQDLIDAQHESGQVPDIVPTPFWGKPTKICDTFLTCQWNEEYTGKMADPWWGGTLVMLPWKIYEHYGDIHILKYSYPYMKKYVEFLLKTTQYSENEYSYLINWKSMLGEWLEVGSVGSANRTPKILTCSQAFYRCAIILAETAKLLGHKSDEERYQTIASKIFKAINEEFLNPNTGEYAKDSQSAQAMSLVLGLVPEEHKTKVFNELVRNIIEVRKGHLSTGIIGSYFLYKALGQNNRNDLAFQVITAKGYPGFEHNLTRVMNKTPLPSTTLWEDWGGIGSLAHPVQGAVVSFFYEYLAGIQPLIEKPGFKEFVLSPQVISQLEWVDARLDTIYGTIISKWKKSESSIELDFQIPVNTSAKIVLSCNLLTEIKINNESVDKCKAILKIEEESGKNTIVLGSGIYHFCINLKI